MAALLKLLINYYIKGSGTTHYTKHEKRKEKKLVGKERQQKKAKYASI